MQTMNISITSEDIRWRTLSHGGRVPRRYVLRQFPRMVVNVDQVFAAPSGTLYAKVRCLFAMHVLHNPGTVKVSDLLVLEGPERRGSLIR